MWCEFKKITNYDRLGVPIWVNYFGYGLTDKEFIDSVDHNNKKFSELPEWKQRFVLKNRDFYLKHKKNIDRWIYGKHVHVYGCWKFRFKQMECIKCNEYMIYV